MAHENFAFLLFTVMLTSGSAIRCFQCSSYEEPSCADIEANDTSSKFLHQCEPREGQTIFCRKTVQTILDIQQFTRVTRDCGWLVHKSNETNCRLADTDFKLERSCQCFSDACNTAANPSVPTLKFLLFSGIFQIVSLSGW